MTSQILNTNGDTIAASVAQALSELGMDVHLYMTMNLDGVLIDKDRPETLIENLDSKAHDRLKADGIIGGGMLPNCTIAFKRKELVPLKSRYVGLNLSMAFKWLPQPIHGDFSLEKIRTNLDVTLTPP